MHLLFIHCFASSLWQGFTKNTPSAQRLSRAMPGGPAARGPQRPSSPRLMMARRPSPDFPPFFVQWLIHAHAQVCIEFGRAKMDDAEFEFVYHYNIKQSFRSFHSLHVAMWKMFSFSVYSSVYKTRKRGKSILNDVSYFQTPVWDWKSHIKLSNEICELWIVTEFMIFSLSKYGLKITYIIR